MTRPTASARPLVVMDQYLSTISEDALLSSAEERSLAEAAARGDSSARARLIRANLRLVVRIARDFQGRGLPMDDLVGEGNLGLIRAADLFDPSRGARFGTYASYWIKQAIRDAVIKTASTVRLPNHMFGLLSRWNRAHRSLARALGREPQFHEVCDALELTGSQRAMLQQARQTRKFASETASEHDGRVFLDQEAADPSRGGEAEIEAREQIEAMKARLARLDDRERQVITLRFGLDGRDPLTLREAGDRLGITREWVRKIELHALDKLGQPETEARRPESSPHVRQPRPHARIA